MKLEGFARYDRWQDDLPLSKEIKVPSPRARFSATERQVLLGKFASRTFKTGALGKEPLCLSSSPGRLKLTRNLSVDDVLAAISQSKLSGLAAEDGSILKGNKQNASARPRNTQGLLKNKKTSLVARDLDLLFPLIKKLNDIFSREFGGSLHTNAYITPPLNQTLKRHWDDHDVFVFQFHGTKRWKIYRPVQDHPTSPGSGPAGALLIEVTLKPGSLLYIPRGFPHEAVSDDDISFHVTFGLSYPHRLQLLPMLLTEVARRAYANKYFRQDVARFDDSVENYFKQAASLFAPGEYETIERLRTLASLPVSNRSRTKRPGAKSYEVSAQPFMLFSSADHNCLRILLPDHEVRLANRYLKPCREIFAGQPVTKIQLDPAELRTLLDLLWREGLIC